jgi:tetratricopeptide (TPR) repeat protein
MRESLRAYGVIALVVAVVLCGRVLLEARSELRAGDAHLTGGRYEAAVRHYRRAAHLYLPGSPYTRDAYEALERVAREAEARGQNDRALAAWRAVRSSALATRWVVLSYEERVTRANRRIARLMARLPPPAVDRGLSLAQLEERHLALLEERTAPDAAWVVLMAIGFATWMGAVAWAALRGWNDDDRAQWPTLRVAGVVVAAGMALFFLALTRA